MTDRLAAAGWSVALLARDAGRLVDARRLEARHGGQMTAIDADVADAPAFDAAADRVANGFGEGRFGAPMGDGSGNLDAPVPCPARIDAGSTNRVIPGRQDAFNPRQRDALKAGAPTGLVGLGATSGPGGPRLPARERR